VCLQFWDAPCLVSVCACSSGMHPASYQCVLAVLGCTLPRISVCLPFWDTPCLVSVCACSSGMHPASYQCVLAVLSTGKPGWDVQLTINVYKVPTLRMHGALPSLPLYAIKALCLGMYSTLPLRFRVRIQTDGIIIIKKCRGNLL
jgi:hypothetical protein